MSVNPNQTNANSSNIFPVFGGGGGGGANLLVNTITGSVYGSNVLDMNNTGAGPLLKTGLQRFNISYDTMADTRVTILPTSGFAIGFTGTSSGVDWVKGDNQNPLGIQFNQVSSISAVGGQGIIDWNAFVSTMSNVYPAIVK